METFMKLRSISCSLAMPFLLMMYSAHANEADQTLLSAAKSEQPKVMDSLRTMVSIESGTMDEPGLSRMADHLQDRLSSLGARVERLKINGAKGDVLIGRYTGSGKRRLMLIAHMDTVYRPGTLLSEPIKLEGNRLYGPGIADDKGGIAVILHALSILRQSHWNNYAQLTVLFNGDEESQSAGSGEIIAALAAEHDTVLSYEPTPAKAVAKAEGVLLAAAGTGTVTLNVKGRSSHAGAAPEEGRNALIELAHQLLQTKDIAKTIPGAQLNWTQAETGSVRNQIPDHATATADIRLTATDAAAKLQTALDAKAHEHKIPDTEASYSMLIGRPPYVGDARTQALAKKAQEIYAELDGRPLIFIPGTGAGTDAGYASRSGKPAVLESLGLAGWGYHAKNEYIEIDSIVPRLYLTTRLLMELGRE
jgi:glutamate carboxypeptidase